ncbi:hypothetical protein VQ02_21520 [Methylobacterium variabile]|uniref:NAD(P)-binding domain-containing protein n=1 Tax=Methylobacterium variabile TaxID=298794 RepID=A0A0J6V2S3_9HYPH|nr:hypothetical protein [Methylobacterium variabile]KMO33136.1 hypothetical protein VQ02_21520 [Methylobacterium variabile]
MASRKAPITGVTGQDGARSSERLLAEGCGIRRDGRRPSHAGAARVDLAHQDPHEGTARVRPHSRGVAGTGAPLRACLSAGGRTGGGRHP